MDKYIKFKIYNIITFILFLFSFSSLLEARRIKNLSSKPSSFKEIVKKVDDKYQALASLWEREKGWDSKYEKLLLLVKILSFVENSMMFDEEGFKKEFSSFWQEIENCRNEILNSPDKRREIISNLLWENLDPQEKNIFRVAATQFSGLNHSQLLFQYLKNINREFISYLFRHPEKQSVIGDFVSSELEDIGIPPKNYIKDWLPKLSQRMENFIIGGELQEGCWRIYINFIKELPGLLSLLIDKGIYTYSLAKKIFKQSLNLASLPEEIENNFLSLEEIVQKLPRGRADKVLLHNILDISFNLSDGLALNYQNNNKAIANLIDKMNKTDVFSKELFATLLNTVAESVNNNPLAFSKSLDLLSGFVESLIPYKEFLRIDGEKIKLKEALEMVLPILRESGDNYILLGDKLSNLKNKLTKYRKETIEKIEQAFKIIEKGEWVDKIGASISLISALKDSIPRIENERKSEPLNEIIAKYYKGELAVDEVLKRQIHFSFGSINLLSPSFDNILDAFKLNILQLLGGINIENFPTQGITPQEIDSIARQEGIEVKRSSLSLGDWFIFNFYFEKNVKPSISEYKGDQKQFLFFESIKERLIDKNLAHYYYLIPEEERNLLNWHFIDATLEEIKENWNSVTAKSIRKSVASIFNKNLVPISVRVAQELGIPDRILIALSWIKNLDLENLITSSYLERITNSSRPLSFEDIEFFLSHFRINGLTMREIERRFFELDEKGRIIRYKGNKEALLNRFINSSEFERKGDLKLSPQGFKDFVNEIYSASTYMEYSPIAFAGEKFDNYGLKPEKFGINGEIFVISRYMFKIKTSEGLEEFQLEFLQYLRNEELKRRECIKALILGSLFTSGVKKGLEYRNWFYRVIDDKGNMIAEFDGNNRRAIIAVYFRDERNQGWARWDVSKNSFTLISYGKDLYFYYEDWGKFLNSLVENDPFVSKD